MIIKGTTESGFDFEIDEDVLDDIDTFEMIADISDPDLTDAEKLPSIRKLPYVILGREQGKKLKEFIREQNGHCRAGDLIAYTMEIFNSANSLKNS